MAATDALEIGSIPDRCLRVPACVWRSRKRERRLDGVHQLNCAWSRICDTLESPAWSLEAVERRVQPKGVSNGRSPAFLRYSTNIALCLGVPQEPVRPPFAYTRARASSGSGAEILKDLSELRSSGYGCKTHRYRSAWQLSKKLSTRRPRSFAQLSRLMPPPCCMC